MNGILSVRKAWWHLGILPLFITLKNGVAHNYKLHLDKKI